MPDNRISILDVVEDTIVDGPGFRTAIYAAGCTQQCPGCHNPDSWDIRRGTPVTVDTILNKVLRNEFADVTFTGGDPLMQAPAFARLAKAIKEQSTKTIWCYTGFTFEAILNNPKVMTLLPYIDILVDGRFVEKLKDESLLFRGSKNQRLIDVKQSLKQGSTVLYKYDPFPATSFGISA